MFLNYNHSLAPSQAKKIGELIQAYVVSIMKSPGSTADPEPQQDVGRARYNAMLCNNVIYLVNPFSSTDR